ncbi:prevent-host-death family protein [Actinomadura hallensis]|uniref:Antitoxin n=2 Tax=Actinomadura hallensis TaxID=337895 RepID=A0A543ILR7_9ACTN|nr:prevent-host-death family protein [Actinomadura hallensis]
MHFYHSAHYDRDMESYPIKEARKRLGDMHAAVVHGRAHPRITKNGRDPVVMITEQEWQELQQLRRERAARLADQEAGRIKPYLDAGRTPPGYEVYTREQVASGDWLA